VNQPPVVERGHDRLADAGGGHDQVAMAVMQPPLRVQRFEDLLLMRQRTHLEAGQAHHGGRRGTPVSCVCKRVVEVVAVLVGVVGDEGVRLPVGVERGGELPDQVGGRYAG
jgi:hypothetical protein